MGVEYQGEDLQPALARLYAGATNATAFAYMPHDLLCVVCTPSRTRKQMWFIVPQTSNHVAEIGVQGHTRLARSI